MRFKLYFFAFFALMLMSVSLSFAQNNSNPVRLNALSIKKKINIEQVSLSFSETVAMDPHFLRAEKNVPYARYYVDFKNTELNPNFNAPTLDQDFKLLSDLRIAQKDPSTVRIVLDLDPQSQKDNAMIQTQGNTVHIYLAKKATDLAILQLEDIPETLDPPILNREPAATTTSVEKGAKAAPVSPLDIEVPSSQTVRITPQKPVAEISIPQPKVEKNQRHRIIVDAGHGGHDAGASGPFYKTKEKDVTLSIAQRLKDILKKDDHYEVLMTRDNDKSLELWDRTNFANQHHGDLFVSIHANANTKHTASGVSTYFLHNADDEESLRVAMRENGELAVPKTNQKNQNDAYFLEVMKASMLKNFHTVQSTDLARVVQNNLFTQLSQAYRDVHNRGVKSARFYVLTGANMPAILVETSFITNKMEENRLRSSAYQYKIALAIYRGIQAYFKQQDKSLSHARMY